MVQTALYGSTNQVVVHHPCPWASPLELVVDLASRHKEICGLVHFSNWKSAQSTLCYPPDPHMLSAPVGGMIGRKFSQLQ